MKIYCVNDRYFSNKKEAMAFAKSEYHIRMEQYGCNMWYEEAVIVTDIDLNKAGVLSVLNDRSGWDIVRDGGWRGSHGQ